MVNGKNINRQGAKDAEKSTNQECKVCVIGEYLSVQRKFFVFVFIGFLGVLGALAVKRVYK